MPSYARMARDAVDDATIKLRSAIASLEAAKQCITDSDRREWLDSAIGLATDAISEAKAAIDPP